MKALLAALSLTLAPVPCAADLIYKYQRADGQILYSSRPMLGAKLIDSIDYTAPPAASPRPETSRSDAEGEARIRTQLSKLEVAWIETQVTGKALAAAEARLAAGVIPQESDVRAIGGPAEPALPSAGGPTPVPGSDSKTGVPTPESIAAGGPKLVPGSDPKTGAATPESIAAGGPMGTRRGGGLRPEFVARMAALEADVVAARTRNQQAWARYNQLR